MLASVTVAAVERATGLRRSPRWVESSQHWMRWRPPLQLGLTLLGLLGAIVTLARLAHWWDLGGWPPHDAASHWLAGIHLRDGSQVYGDWAGSFNYLMFLYGPPWVVIDALISFLPLDVYAGGLLVAQVLALRYVMGSWLMTGMIAWFPIVADELSIGNIDFLMAAVILAGVRGVRGSGAAAALFAFAKFSPLLAISRKSLGEAAIACIVAIAITFPWVGLWPQWLAMLLSLSDGSFVIVPILPRIPLVIILLAVQRDWAKAAAVAVATPAFYFHSLVLLLPAARLALGSVHRSRTNSYVPSVESLREAREFSEA